MGNRSKYIVLNMIMKVRNTITNCITTKDLIDEKL